VGPGNLQEERKGKKKRRTQEIIPPLPQREKEILGGEELLVLKGLVGRKKKNDATGSFLTTDKHKTVLLDTFLWLKGGRKNMTRQESG